MKNLFLLVLCPLIVFAKKAPDFTITDYKKQVHKLYEDYLNKDKVVVIKFFFVDCPPCNSLAPYVKTAYTRWGSGANRVEFIELSTQNWDDDSAIKRYADLHGVTYPIAGFDGGAYEATAPYKAGTFGTFYGTPSFAVISPDGEVSYPVQFSATNQVAFDTAVARALRVTNGGGTGGNECTKAFSISTVTQLKPTQIIVQDLVHAGPEYVMLKDSYNCEFILPQNSADYSLYIKNTNVVSNPIAGITTADVLAIQKFLLGITSMNNMQLAVADVTGNGSVTVSDMVEIRKVILGVNRDFTRVSSYAVCHDPKGLNQVVTGQVKVDDLISKKINNEFGTWRYGDVNGITYFKNEISTTRASDIPIKIVETKLTNNKYKYSVILNADIQKIAGFQMFLNTGVNNINNISNFQTNSTLFGFDGFISQSEIRTLWSDPNASGIDLIKDFELLSFESNTKLTLNLPTTSPSEVYFEDGSEGKFNLSQSAENVDPKRIIANFEKDMLYIFTDQNKETIPTNFELIDLSGNKIFSSKEFVHRIPSTGATIYFLRTTYNNGEVKTQKLFKQN